MMRIEKYKPKYHHNPDNCNDNCEKDCCMECHFCRRTPYETKYYYILKGDDGNIQFCEKCWKELNDTFKSDKLIAQETKEAHYKNNQKALRKMTRKIK